jgi:hypothetical protein
MDSTSGKLVAMDRLRRKCLYYTVRVFGLAGLTEF